MDWFDHSEYAIIPAGNGLNAIRQYNKTDEYAEKLLFRDNYYVWLVRIPVYRCVCRDWASKRFKKPTIQECVELCGLASSILHKPLPKRKKADGTPAYQWLQRWIRAELHLLKYAAILWLGLNATSTPHHYFLETEQSWMCDGVSEVELDHAWNYENGVLVRMIDVEGIKISAPLMHETEIPDDHTSSFAIPNYRLALKEEKPEEIMKKMWRFLPTNSEDSIFGKVPPQSPLFPEEELIARNPKGGAVMAQWMRVQRYKLNRENAFPEEKQKRVQQRDRAIRAMDEPTSSDVFGF
jgi:hypothetical protein